MVIKKYSYSQKLSNIYSKITHRIKLPPGYKKDKLEQHCLGTYSTSSLALEENFKAFSSSKPSVTFFNMVDLLS